MRRCHTVALAIGLVAAIGVTGAVAAEKQAAVAKKSTVVNDPRGDSNLPECDITKVTVKHFDVTSGTVEFKDQPLDQVTYTFKAKDFGISKKFKWQVEQCTPLGSPSDDFVPDSGMKSGKLKK